MKHPKYFLTVVLVLLLINLAPSVESSIPKKFHWRTLPNAAFGGGEELVFSMGWKAAKAGSARFRIGETVQRNKRPAYHVLFEASSNSIIDKVFMVRDRMESWMDVESLASVGYAQQLDEGGYRRNKTVFISPEKESYRSRDIRPSKSKHVETSQGGCPPFVQDPVSALLYVRAQSFRVGEEIPFSVLNNEKLLNVVLRVVSKENIEVPAGRYSSFKCELLLRTTPAVPRNSSGTLLVWFTDDVRHIPVKIAATLPFGSLNADLNTYTPASK